MLTPQHWSIDLCIGMHAQSQRTLDMATSASQGWAFAQTVLPHCDSMQGHVTMVAVKPSVCCHIGSHTNKKEVALQSANCKM